ncbi:MAG TPA: bifunctional homocysteine S-methyltransferase/methylenetetrahydrofolate reductase [Chthoniobacterales bacterium]|nr:bifunctional homocysteine S-methyltransferase/methylenetetrahydrofolate reductase [Chthoniobacterales bacterium]
MNLLDELQERIVCGDGAMGTLLLDRGVPVDHCLEELCESEPERIQAIHEEYIAAGARVIETNTFGANAVRLARFGLENRVREINKAAAGLARKAARGKEVCVAGSVGPLGISASEAEERGIDRAQCFSDQITALLEADVDLIFFETFLNFEEMEIALRAMPQSEALIVSLFACEPEGRLQSSMLLTDAFARCHDMGAKIVGANCLNGPHAMVQLFEKLPAGDLLAAYANAGYPRYTEGRYVYPTAPDYFAKAAREMAAQGARLIGGCCGTTPAHVAAVSRALVDLKPVTQKSVRVISSPVRPPVGLKQTDEESLLDKIASGKRVVICELDPPKTLALEKYFEGAQALVKAGCDAITLADNSLAILRVSNLAIAAMLKERFGITSLLHLSCRDRNVLGLQSELLGMAALGMRHVLPLTGDPARVGDHPGAASVYDVTSVELISIIRQMNAGFTQAGKPLKAVTKFVIGCTFNPNAKNLDAQVERLQRKVAAGAQFVMTQPVFDVDLVKEMHRRVHQLRVPMFTGVWPLQSAKQAEFLHHEVPGIIVPERVRSELSSCEGKAAEACGLKLAEKIIAAALDFFPGVYLITPFLRYEATSALAGFARTL